MATTHFTAWLLLKGGILTLRTGTDLGNRIVEGGGEVGGEGEGGGGGGRGRGSREGSTCTCQRLPSS